MNELRLYKVEVNGRTYAVSIEQNGHDKFRARLNDKVLESEAVARDEISIWITHSEDRTVRAQTRVLHNDNVEVWLGGVPFLTSVKGVVVGTHPFSAERRAERQIGGEIRALMPGRVTSILVKDGDPVEVDTPLLVLEAMKMQNEIASPISGRVKSVLVQEGSTVKKDSVLILIE